MIEPKGGTELQLEFLQKYVDKNLLDKFQICTSVPGKIPIDKNKINILWQKNSYDQPNIKPFFEDKKTSLITNVEKEVKDLLEEYL